MHAQRLCNAMDLGRIQNASYFGIWQMSHSIHCSPLCGATVYPHQIDWNYNRYEFVTPFISQVIFDSVIKK